MLVLVKYKLAAIGHANSIAHNAHFWMTLLQMAMPTSFPILADIPASHSVQLQIGFSPSCCLFSCNAIYKSGLKRDLKADKFGNNFCCFFCADGLGMPNCFEFTLQHKSFFFNAIAIVRSIRISASKIALAFHFVCKIWNSEEPLSPVANTNPRTHLLLFAKGKVFSSFMVVAPRFSRLWTFQHSGTCPCPCNFAFFPAGVHT